MHESFKTMCFQYVDCQWGEVQEDKGGINGDRRRRVGEHTVQYTDNVLYNCIPPTYIILLRNVTSINASCVSNQSPFFSLSQEF